METKDSMERIEENGNKNKTETIEKEEILRIKSIGWKIIPFPPDKTRSLVKMYFEGPNKEKAIALFLFKKEFTSIIETIFKKRMMPIMPGLPKEIKIEEDKKCEEPQKPSGQYAESDQCLSGPEKPDLK